MLSKLYSTQAGRRSNLNLMSEEALQQNTTFSVGQLLKTARLARDLTLEAVAKSLRISKRHLTLIEEDNETLVCDVYTIGFLRSYAQYLELDQDNLIQKFKNQTAAPQPSPITFPAPLPERGMPSFRILGLSLLALGGVIIMGWKWFGYYDSAPSSPEEPAFIEPQVKVEEPISFEETTSLPLQEKLRPVSAPEESPSAIEKPSAALLPSARPVGVLLKATEEAWIEVKDKNGNIILSRLFGPGDSYEFNNPQNLILKTGNAKGTQLISGKKIQVFTKSSESVKSNIPLDPEKWVEQTPETH